ncbi:hypothetical protein EMIT0P176_20272 [Pseudomonas sp. IT-P176]
MPEGELPSAERFFRFGASKPRKHSVMNGCYRPEEAVQVTHPRPYETEQLQFVVSHIEL